ncbi:MAG: molybdopterin-dependent oxidoreductase [Gaiellaceae bacterium]
MSELAQPELVTVTIDGRAIEIPKGTGMVEAALSAGIEIPVFCYEPRLGPPLGACRMCLCELEGVPKLQAACTLSAQDGMELKTAATSNEAKEGQEAILEFILLNHPLDCPDCDKGGECPLQDLTFRYGPPATRMRFTKRTFDKPIPISPLIALDRERCILCYRCTRFSEQVAEDGQLVAMERGANSYIATFEDEPYRAHFSGNVVELCPVGALTSTAYRFQARPWEIQNVPSVCGHCSVGCNIWATTREGKVVRVLGRNHPEVDEGWLCDKGRYALGDLNDENRLTAPLQRVRRRGFEPISLEHAAEVTAEALRAAEGSIAVAFSGTESVEQADAIAQIARGACDAHTALLPDDPHPSLDAFRAPLSAIREADICLVLGDEPVVERAPIVDLWLRAARRDGARVITVGPAGSIQIPPGSAASVATALLSADPPEELSALRRSLREAQRVAIVWSEDDATGGQHAARLAEALELGEGSGVYWLPSTPNGRGVAAAWHSHGERSQVGGLDGATPRALIVSGDAAAADPRVLSLAEQADFVLTTSMFMSEVASWSHIVLPDAAFLERDGTSVNLEGRAQRQQRAVAGPDDDVLSFYSQLGGQFELEIASWPDFDGILDQAELPERAADSAGAPPAAEAPALPANGFSLVSYSSAFSGRAVELTPSLEFQRPAASIELAAADAERLGVARGDEVTVASNGTSVALRAEINRRLLPGVVRAAEEHVSELDATVEVTRSAIPTP